MSRPVMVDSSWYIQRAREGNDPLLLLAAQAEVRDIAVCGLITCELGRGIRDPNALKKFRRAWELMLYVESTAARWNETLELARQLDRAGQVIPIQDLHIAACALHIGAVVLTEDSHFTEIPSVDATRMLY